MGLARRNEEINVVLRSLKSIVFIGKTLLFYERFFFVTQDQQESGTVDQYFTEVCQIAANCDFESITPTQLLQDQLLTGNKTAKVHKNLLKVKKLTFEKAIDIARATKSTAVQMKVISAESGLSAVKENDKSSQKMPHLSAVAGSRTVDSVVGTTKAAAALPLARFVHNYCKKRNRFTANCPAKSKVSTVQEQFYLSAAGVGNNLLPFPSVRQQM